MVGGSTSIEGSSGSTSRSGTPRMAVSPSTAARSGGPIPGSASAGSGPCNRERTFASKTGAISPPALSAASRKSTNGVDQELVRQAVERGRLLEQLSGSAREPGTLFLVGLFSLLDAVFRMTLPEILERVALSDDANSALLDRTGPYADALTFAESYELGMFESAAEIAKEMRIDPLRMGEMYTNSLSWTNEALGTMLEKPPVQPVKAGR